MEIEIIPINLTQNAFDNLDQELTKLQFSKYCHVSNTNFINSLLISPMPIDNKRLAIKNILEFLTFIDTEIKMKESTLIPISSKILMSFFTNDYYKEYMKLLKNLDIISDVAYEDGSFYQKGTKFKLYRVHNTYLNNQDLCIVILSNDRAKDKFICDVKVDDRFCRTIKNLEINMRNAILDEISHCRNNNLSSNNLRIRISRIFYTRMRRFIKSGKKVNRIYHSFSNVSKVSRRHLNIKMYNIDIKNSQPLLLASYLKKSNLLIDQSYLLDCESGKFYDRFVGSLTRDDVKVALYKNIFFGFNQSSKINIKFKSLYPKTWESLLQISNSKESLAERLQNLESELFNNLVPKKSKHYFTLFDAIYFDNVNDVQKLNDSIHSFFDEMDVKVSTEVEY